MTSPANSPPPVSVSPPPPTARGHHGHHISISTAAHADRPNTARTSLLSPQSPTASAFGGGRRLSVASHTRRRNNTVTSSKYVTLIPGAEPGLAPENQEVDLYAQCGITVVDFNEERILQTELENESLLTFLEEERPEWSKVRWINVNGLSWDCISAVAKKWNLHRLGVYN